MGTLNRINKLAFLLILLLTITSCKNNAQDKSSLNTKQITLNGLPDEIANKTWIYLSELPEYHTYKHILDYNDEHSIKTKKNILYTVLDVYEGYHFEIKFDSVILKNDTYQINFKHKEIDYAKFKWINKEKGIGTWEIRYLRYFDGHDSIVKRKSVIKSFVNSKSFPEPEPEKIVLEKEKLEKCEFTKIEKLPLLGKFTCINEPMSSLSFKLKKTNLRGKGGIIEEVQPYEAIISIDEYIHIGCSLRKVSGYKNKYVLLYKYTKNTKYHPEDKLYYSKTNPIAEIEILDDGKIKNKWIGMYNRRTKKVEGYGVYNWIGSCDNLLTKIEE